MTADDPGDAGNCHRSIGGEAQTAFFLSHHQRVPQLINFVDSLWREGGSHYSGIVLFKEGNGILSEIDAGRKSL